MVGDPYTGLSRAVEVESILRVARQIHPEHVPGSICIPPAPDASASTLPARAPCAGCGVHFNRQVNELLHEEAYFLNHAPSCDGTAHGEV